MRPTRYRLNKISHAGDLYEFGGAPVNRSAAIAISQSREPIRGWVMGTDDGRYASKQSKAREQLEKDWAAGNFPALAVDLVFQKNER